MPPVCCHPHCYLLVFFLNPKTVFGTLLGCRLTGSLHVVLVMLLAQAKLSRSIYTAVTQSGNSTSWHAVGLSPAVVLSGAHKVTDTKKRAASFGGGLVKSRPGLVLEAVNVQCLLLAQQHMPTHAYLPVFPRQAHKCTFAVADAAEPSQVSHCSFIWMFAQSQRTLRPACKANMYPCSHTPRHSQANLLVRFHNACSEADASLCCMHCSC